MRSPRSFALAVVLWLCALPPSASAQDQAPLSDPSSAAPDEGASDEGAGAPSRPGVTARSTPLPSPPQVFIPGYPAPGTDLSGHLPSSARPSTDVSRSSDGFDLVRRSEGPTSVRGSEGGAYVLEGQYTPEAHTVRRGDTLWDISSRYYQNPYSWPRLWAQNPQILNPHWIYPGDRVRLRELGPGASGDRRIAPSKKLPPKTVFLRDVGFIDDAAKDTWGELVGSPDDQMLLSEGDDIYVQLEGDHAVSVGQELTLFRPLRDASARSNSEEQDEKGAEPGQAKGQLVSIRGTARVERYNVKTKMLKAKIVESLDVIERGAKVGPVGRKFDVVPPVASDKDIEARILASIYPYQLYGQHHVVFLDRGEKDGVKVGQRFFAVRRGDRWQQKIQEAGPLAMLRPQVEDDKPAKVEEMSTGVDAGRLPEEMYAELRVLRVREGTSTALVTASTHEIDRSARLVSRKGL